MGRACSPLGVQPGRNGQKLAEILEKPRGTRAAGHCAGDLHESYRCTACRFCHRLLRAGHHHRAGAQGTRRHVDPAGPIVRLTGWCGRAVRQCATVHPAGLKRHAILAAALLALVVGLLLTPRIPQDRAYHQFADQRTIARIPNALNVLSNLPFAFVGIAGLFVTFAPTTRFTVPFERWPYAALFAGSALTALGSSYYHLQPDNARLVWDRLPMTLGFMGLLVATIAERIGTRAARPLLVPSLVVGAASVFHWYWTEVQGAGELRWYALVQFGSLIGVVLMLMLYPPRYSHTTLIVAGLGAYALAKVLELADGAIFNTGHLVSGHSLKHLAAAAGVGLVVAALRRRRPLAAGHSPTMMYS